MDSNENEAVNFLPLKTAPSGWEVALLSQICKVEMGQSPPSSTYNYQRKGLPFFQGKAEFGDLYPTVEKYCSEPKKKADKEAVLLSVRAPVGPTNLSPSESCIGRGLAGISPLAYIPSKFILYFFRAIEPSLSGAGTGSTFKAISGQYLKNVRVNLAPLQEQHRIVTKIEELFSELDQGVESLKTARAQLKTYRQSLLKAAFEGRLTGRWREELKRSGRVIPVRRELERMPPLPKPNRWKTRSKDVIYGHPCLAVGNPATVLPYDWGWVPLVEIARMESGHTPSRRHPEWWGGNIPWIGIADARENDGSVINNTKQHTNEEGLANSASRLLPKGTVCVSRTASVGYVVETGREMATSQDFVNWVPSQLVTAAWLRLVFGAHKEYLLRFSKGTTHRTIYFPEWLSVHIGLPPLEEQRRIVEEVEAKFSEMDSLDESIECSLWQSEQLRQSILKRAFEGKLVPQDPNDEPASELLERIRRKQSAEPTIAGKRRRSQKATADLLNDES